MGQVDAGDITFALFLFLMMLVK